MNGLHGRLKWFLCIITVVGFWTVAASAGWYRSSRCSDNRLLDVCCAPDGNAWCVSTQKEAFHWNGYSWEPLDYGAPRDLRAVWGFANDDVYMVGGPDVLHWDGQTWSVTEPGGDDLKDVWGFGSDHVIITGGNTIHQGSCAGGWSTYVSPGLPELYDIWGSGPNDIYVIATNGRYTHFDGTSWTTHQTDFAYQLMGIWGFAANDIYIVGYDQSVDASLILHFDGTDWTPMTAPSTAFLYHVWGPAPDDIYAVGGFSYGSEILHYNGTEWQALPEADRFLKLFGIHGASADSFFAVGDYIAHMQAGPQMALDLNFDISHCRVTPGDTFSVALNIWNVITTPEASCFVIVALDVAGQFFFWPSWGTDYDSFQTVPTQSSEQLSILAPFTWPDTGTGTFTGIRFWSVVLADPSMQIMSDIATVTWGYGP